MCLRLSKLHNKTSIKITNGFDIDEKIVKKNLLKKTLKLNKTLKIVYTGSIYTDGRNPTLLLNAISNLVIQKKIPKKSIILEFYGSRLDSINNLSQQPKYSDLIQKLFVNNKLL